MVCNKMKGVSWDARIKLVSAMISLAWEKGDEDQSSPTQGILANDGEDLDEIPTTTIMSENVDPALDDKVNPPSSHAQYGRRPIEKCKNKSTEK